MLCDDRLGVIVGARLKSGMQMSEPVSTAEIEDVLSSIRRLVSNDVEAAQENAAAEVAAEEPAGKLILTADFRVSESQDEDEDEDVGGEDGGPVEAPLEFHHADHSADAETDFEAQVDLEIETEPEIVPEAKDTSNEVWQDAEEVEPVAASTSQLEDTIAELEAAIGQQDGEWEPDGSDFEEDIDAEEMMSEPVQDWIDGTAQEVVEEAGVEAEPAMADMDADTDAVADKGDTDLFGGDESVIDEETLRDMVSDIVRQELQGALGERITRNVRKLVRREINRVLASQEFD